MKKQISAFIKATKDDLGVAITDFIAGLPDDEYLVRVDAKLGFDKDGKPLFGICFNTQVGEEPKPMPYSEPMC